MRRDLLMGKLNPEKSSQRKITKAYGKSLPEDEIISIMGRAIPPE
jgi:hypothetical protein